MTVVARTFDALLQKFNSVKSACRKMLGFWTQVHTPPKSGWSDADYKAAANDRWLLAKDSLGAGFEFWHVFDKLSPVLTSEDCNAELLRNVEVATEEGVSGAKKYKEIRKHLKVKEEVEKEIEKIQVSHVLKHVRLASEPLC